MRLIYYFGLVNNKLATFCRNHSWCKYRQHKLTSRGVDFFLVFVLLFSFFLAFVFFFLFFLSENATSAISTTTVFCIGKKT